MLYNFFGDQINRRQGIYWRFAFPTEGVWQGENCNGSACFLLSWFWLTNELCDFWLLCADRNAKWGRIRCLLPVLAALQNRHTICGQRQKGVDFMRGRWSELCFSGYVWMVMLACSLGQCALLIHAADVLTYILISLQPASCTEGHFKKEIQ